MNERNHPFEVRDGSRVILRTDDWIEAEEAASVKHWRHKLAPLRIAGIHPSHSVGTVTKHYGYSDTTTSYEGCATCEAPNNGCFAIHAPCGFDFGNKSMATIIEEWRAERESVPS